MCVCVVIILQISAIIPVCVRFQRVIFLNFYFMFIYFNRIVGMHNMMSFARVQNARFKHTTHGNNTKAKASSNAEATARTQDETNVCHHWVQKPVR